MTLLVATSSSPPCITKLPESATSSATTTPERSTQIQTARDKEKRGHEEEIAEERLGRDERQQHKHDDMPTIHRANKLATTTTVTTIRTAAQNLDDEIMKDAECYVQNHLKKSLLLGGTPFSDDIPKFQESELIVGNVLGHGGFCIVHEVRLTKPLSRDNNFDELEDSVIKANHRYQFFPVSALRKQNSMKEMNHRFSCNPFVSLTKAIDRYKINHNHHEVHYPYAMKRIDPRLYQNIHHKPTNKKAKQKLVCGIADLVLESKYLSKLNHPHIIQVRGMSTHSPYNYHCHFMLLDKLSCMLTQKIYDWKTHYHFHHPNPLTHLLLDRKGGEEQAFFYIRLGYAYDIATAIDYVHQNNIIYRDVKPDNIGFDMMDEIKLTDFGLIKEINPATRHEDGLFYNISDMAGSYYYIDPRAALGLPINESCDVYSFCILLWQILKLEQPFESFTHEMLKYDVYVLKDIAKRPKLSSKWPHTIRDMVGRGWSYDYKIRPTMKDICHIIHEEIEHYYQNNHHDHHHVIHDRDDEALTNQNRIIRQTVSEIEL